MKNLKLVIGNKNYSSWSLRPWVLLKHFNIDFTEKRIPLFTEKTQQQLSHYDSDFKVPVLVDDDLVVWDSLAIVEYISEKYLDARAWPADVKTRALARSLSAEMHSSFAHIRTGMPMNCGRPVSPIRLSLQALHEVERVKFLWTKCRDQYSGQGEWLFGQYSIADAMYAPIVLRFMSYAIPLTGKAGDYMQTVLRHPAIIEWMKDAEAETEVIEKYEI